MGRKKIYTAEELKERARLRKAKYRAEHPEFVARENKLRLERYYSKKAQANESEGK